MSREDENRYELKVKVGARTTERRGGEEKFGGSGGTR